MYDKTYLRTTIHSSLEVQDNLLLSVFKAQKCAGMNAIMHSFQSQKFGS